MSFTDTFIQRPVLAVVVSSLLLLLGAASMSRVGIREFPELERSVIHVDTVYRGASARTVQGFVTTPLQLSIAGAEADYDAFGSAALINRNEIAYDYNVIDLRRWLTRRAHCRQACFFQLLH